MSCWNLDPAAPAAAILCSSLLESKTSLAHTTTLLPFTDCSARMLRACLFTSLLAAYATAEVLKALPVVIWHGLGDSNANEGLVDLGDAITAKYNVSVFYVQLAKDPKLDQSALSRVQK
jgi:hypothetical protein